MVRFPGAPYIYVLCNINPTNIQRTSRTDELVTFLWGRGHFQVRPAPLTFIFLRRIMFGVIMEILPKLLKICQDLGTRVRIFMQL